MCFSVIPAGGNPVSPLSPPLMFLRHSRRRESSHPAATADELSVVGAGAASSGTRRRRGVVGDTACFQELQGGVSPFPFRSRSRSCKVVCPRSRSAVPRSFVPVVRSRSAGKVVCPRSRSCRSFPFRGKGGVSPIPFSQLQTGANPGRFRCVPDPVPRSRSAPFPFRPVPVPPRSRARPVPVPVPAHDTDQIDGERQRSRFHLRRTTGSRGDAESNGTN